VGRFLIGIGIGVSAVVVPAYLGEVAPARQRGRIVEVRFRLLKSADFIVASRREALMYWRSSSLKCRLPFCIAYSCNL